MAGLGGARHGKAGQAGHGVAWPGEAWLGKAGEGQREEDMEDQPDRLAYKPTEAAELLGVSKGFIYQLIEQGDIDVIRIGSRIIIPAKSVQNFLDGAA